MHALNENKYLSPYFLGFWELASGICPTEPWVVWVEESVFEEKSFDRIIVFEI
jgi:hypothetical protein